MTSADTPTLVEIIQLTRSELTPKQDDPIRECGTAPLDLLPRDPDMCLRVAYQHLHVVPYKDVKTCWRRYYVDSALYKVLEILEKRRDGDATRTESGAIDEDWITEVVKVLDMALILTGAPRREELVELWFSALKGMLDGRVDKAEERHAKRRKIDSLDGCVSNASQFPETFPTTICWPPKLRFPIPRVSNVSLEAFQTKISKPEAQLPMIIEGAIEHWPALDERPWKRPGYLLEQTLGGRRLVPVEIGRSYTDQDWGQKILTFGRFMKEYMFGPQEDLESLSPRPHGSDHMHRALDVTSDSHEIPSLSAERLAEAIELDTETPQTGYLAQHDLFAQIPSLRADISIPDYCYCDPAPQPSNSSNVKPVSKLEEPLLNAWFGPAGTISPLHTDPYHNMLAQVVGYKYIRLYAPDRTPSMYPRGVDENGIDMSNTSRVDLDVAMGVWKDVSCWEGGEPQEEAELWVGEEERRMYESEFPDFRSAKYMEGVLGPGQCLYLPVGWWHYVRSLTPSFSVSFWFN